MQPLLDIDINPGPVEQEKQVKPVARRPRWWRDPLLLCYGCLAISSLSLVITGIVILVQIIETNPYTH